MEADVRLFPHRPPPSRAVGDRPAGCFKIYFFHPLTETVYSGIISANRFGQYCGEAILLEKFLSLPPEKQKAIVDAALAVFGASGYKKTSVNDIAVAAGISKAMVFHYFGTKKALYLYLTEECGRTLMQEETEKIDKSATDFFDRVILATDIKISMMKKHPAILSFLNSAYFETDPEVKGELQDFFTADKGENFRQRLVFDGMDASKFKDGVDPALVMKMLTLIGYGYMNASPLKTQLDLDAVGSEFKACVSLLRSNLYKEDSR